GVYLNVPERPDLQQLARRQCRGHRILPQLRCAVRDGRCQEQCGVRQHGRRRHAELHVRERLYLHLVHLNTARAVSEWFEEPDFLPQRVPGAVTLLYSVLSLERLEKLESVAGTRGG